MIFQHYARDLEAVQVQYEAQKHNPPVPHNVPPTAGNIMWSRQLLSRIEQPMQLFAPNKALMAMKESKKVIKLYNRVGLGCAVAQTAARCNVLCMCWERVFVLQLCLNCTTARHNWHVMCGSHNGAPTHAACCLMCALLCPAHAGGQGPRRV